MSDRKPPVIEDAPGLTWRPRKYGWEARWRARADLVAKGYRPANVRLFISDKDHQEPSEVAKRFIADRCNAFQNEMLTWGRGGIPTVSAFDGTIDTLIGCYQTDPDSTFRKVRFRTRDFYTTLCKRISKDIGHERLSDIKARHVMRYHEMWSAEGKIPMAHSLIGMLRTLIGFGATFLEDEDCERLTASLHRMRFKMGKPRGERLTSEQADMIRAAAHKNGRPSVALGQALQFDLMLRQRDVIGEWVPLEEPGPLSYVLEGNDKWIRGLRWEEIDQNFTLKHVTSKRQKEIEVNLTLAPMVMEEFRKLLGLPLEAHLSRDMLPAKGPIVVSEFGNVPWTGQEYRRWWRKLANECGIPNTVRNMDSRAGAISEATDAGAELEHIRHAATHSDIGMTQKYSRGGTEKTANVMKLRVEHRNKK